MDKALNANTWRSKYNSMFYIFEFLHLSLHNIKPMSCI